jgi:hypothetical protein
VNERRDDLSTTDLAGQQPAGAAPPRTPADDADRDAAADRSPAHRDTDVHGRDDAEVHRTGSGGGPLDRIRRAFGADDRGADDRGADDRGADDRGADDRGADLGADHRADHDRGADLDADHSADHDRGADLGADGAAGPVDRVRDAVGADDRGADAGADRGADADADRGADTGAGGALPGPGVLPAGNAVAATPNTGTPASAPGGGPMTGPLLPPAESEGYRARWTDVQNGFVDSPRQAVEQADRLTADLMQHLAKIFADERSQLESQWDRGGDVATDDLRTAFQRYRSFFERLLST